MEKKKLNKILTINDRSQVQINKIASSIFKEKKKNVQKVGRYVKSEIVKAMSVNTYSLVELRELKHPYKKNQFPKRINVGVIPPLKSYNIHSRSTDLVKGVKYRTKERKQKSGNSFYIEIYHTLNVPYAASVFFGSKKMLKRDPFTKIYKLPKVQKKIKEILES